VSAARRFNVFIVLWHIAFHVPVHADDLSADHSTAIEQLERSALNLNVEIDRLVEDAACPAEHSLTIYIGKDLDNFSLAEVLVNIDEEPGIIKSFDPMESKSLARGNLYRLFCVPLVVGQHKLHVEVQLSNSTASTTITSLSDDETFEADSQTPAIEVSLDRKTPLPGPSLSLRVLRTLPAPNVRKSGFSELLGFIHAAPNTTYSLGDVDDPNVLYAHYLANIGARFSALTRLMSFRSHHPSELLAPGFDIELATALLDVGMLQAASDASQRANAEGEQRSRLVTVRLRIALALYRQGEFVTAEKQLAELRPLIDQHQLYDWQDVQSRILLAQGRYSEASSLLMKIENRSDYESYVRYFDLGIALLKTGYPEQGTTVLDRVGKISTDNLLLGTLRDRANLTLGDYFLNQLQGATAIPIFQRISSQGPYASRALLELGWARLAPSGGTQYKSALGDERTVGPPPEAVLNYLPSSNDQNLYQRYGLRPFERANVVEDESIRRGLALTDWSELKARDATDPAVQEGLLAIGFALNRLGAHDDAVKYYERGVAAIDATKAELRVTESYCRSIRWIDQLLQIKGDDEPGDPIVVRNLPSPRIAAFLDDVIASDRFQQALRNYRDLQSLESVLQAAAAKMASFTNENTAMVGTIESLRARLVALRGEIKSEAKLERERAIAIAINDIEAQERRIKTLSESGHFGLARAYDQSTQNMEP
jgi:tetratricopeptide (TPR) repeat protein